jgi:hypothetical protein
MAVSAALSLATHADEPAYRIDAVQVGVTSTAVVLAVSGAVLAIRARRADLSVLATAASILVLFGVLALLSVGVLLLLLAAWPGWAILRRLRYASGDAAPGLVAGALIAAGLAALLVVTPRPLVRCLEGGATSSSGWRDAGATSGESVSNAEGMIRGTIRVGRQSYVWECRDGDLTRFEPGT